MLNEHQKQYPHSRPILDRARLPTNLHHLSVMTDGDVLPVIGFPTTYPRYYLRFCFEETTRSLFHLFSVDGPEVGQHRLIACIVPTKDTPMTKDDMLTIMASSPDRLQKLWADVEEAIRCDLAGIPLLVSHGSRRS